MPHMLFNESTDRQVSRVEINLGYDIVNTPQLKVDYYDSQGRKGGGITTSGAYNITMEKLLEMVSQVVCIKETPDA